MSLAYGQVWRKGQSIYMAVGPVAGRKRAWNMLLIARETHFWGDGQPLFRMGQSEHVVLGIGKWERIEA